MNCLPFKKLLNFGRRISNMALKIKTNKYNVLNNGNESSYKHPAFIDSEIEKNHSGALFSSFSSGFVSPGLSEPPSFTSLFVQNKEKTENNNDTFSMEFLKEWNQSKADKWEESVDSLFDPKSKHYGIFENFVQSRGFSECSLFSYSPLSSLDSIPNDQNQNDLYFNDNSLMQLECIRKEFEMNGKSVDISPPEENFQPIAMSTPFVERKSDQFKLNNGMSRRKRHLAQHTVPNFQQKFLNYDYLYPMELNRDIAGMLPMSENFPPLSPVSIDKWANKSKGKRNDHQIQPQFFPQNHLPLINNNNPNHKFGGTTNIKKMATKKKNKKNAEDHCVFCKNNGVEEVIYRSHTVKDSKGRVLCPKLRAYQCPICGMDGDQSHTVKYCPKKPIVTMEDLKKLDTAKIRSLPKLF